MKPNKTGAGVQAQEIPSHTDLIVCPECNTTQTATVLHTRPWYTYIHKCRECEYTIMESEWNSVNEDEIGNYDEEE